MVNREWANWQCRSNFHWNSVRTNKAGRSSRCCHGRRFRYLFRSRVGLYRSNCRWINIDTEREGHSPHRRSCSWLGCHVGLANRQCPTGVPCWTTSDPDVIENIELWTVFDRIIRIVTYSFFRVMSVLNIYAYLYGSWQPRNLNRLHSTAQHETNLNRILSPPHVLL